MNPQFEFNLPANNTTEPGQVGIFESAITLMKCRECNTFFNTVNSELVDHCFYCNSKDVYNAGVVNTFKDYSVIPFEKDLSFAIKEYKKRVTINPIIPLIFRKKQTIQSLAKLFIPCKLYQVRASGSIIVAGENIPINKDYNNIIVTNYSNLEYDFSNINNYDISKLTSFTNEHLKDCVYIEGNIEQNILNEKVQKEVLRHAIIDVKKDVRSVINKVDTTNLGVTTISEKDILVPVYLLNIKEEDKNTIFLLNGQNGHTTFKPPIGKKELIICIGIILLLIILLIIVF